MEEEEEDPKKKGVIGKILLGVTGGVAIGLSVIAFPFVTPALRKVCLPYVPATEEQVSNILKALKGRKGRVVDLGSGDGRVVLSVAKDMKLHSTGVELNPWLVVYSRFQAWRLKERSNASFVKKDLWKLDLSAYENVVIFGVEEMMSQLEEKLSLEASHGTHIIACRFPLPNWTAIATIGEGIDTVWVYQKPTRNDT